ncbi:hypothetical protein AA0242T_0137 [Acetobacter aceti NRIC 0242]|nr:FkbM family methyltransferase [Acetobacter aceti]TCS35345.1 FkbM family methyltransferase [Acetobacter aceti NBRC 14818]GAN57443.1 methyltransferase FkbM [Acetobacter aceti NBRC 14818]GBO79435.1 hypothetical protein AA0242T_0137 [Acetobacter aceti NRIC 0242]
MEKSISFAGRDFFFDDVDGKDQIAQQIRNGSFEQPLPIMIMASLSRMGGTFLDVGANSGIYTILACATSPEIKVLAFEPYPLVREALQKNVIVNGYDQRVSLFPYALSDQEGTLPLYIPDDSHGVLETSCSLESTFKDNISHTISVDVKTMDSFGLYENISVIKVDIEGHEPSFMKGAIETIKRNRPIIFCEILSSDTGFFNSFLPSVGYYDFRLRHDMAILDERIAFDNHSWNHAFVPREKLSVFYDCCRTHGLEVVKKVVI